jgi:hypothetical protein
MRRFRRELKSSARAARTLRSRCAAVVVVTLEFEFLFEAMRFALNCTNDSPSPQHTYSGQR